MSPDRRTVLKYTAALTAGAAWSAGRSSAADSRPTTGLGLVVYDCNTRRKWLRQRDDSFDLFDPLTFLKHCHALGAGGMQAALRVMTPAQVEPVRKFAAEHRLFIDGIISPPENTDDLARFEAEVMTARDVGVQAVRTVVMPGRRYERFKSLAEAREFERRAEAMLTLAAPVVEKHRVRLAVENHKDQRVADRVTLLKRIGSEYVGACVDTGNSFALLDDPYGAVEALAPFAFSVHLKDQALQPHDEGFLLGDTPLGRGSFDLPRMVRILRKAKPGLRFALELITRDALTIPCFSEKYWATLPGVLGRDLARTVRFVRDHPSAIQVVGTLTPEKQLALEDANIATSLEYARKELAL